MASAEGQNCQTERHISQKPWEGAQAKLASRIVRERAPPPNPARATLASVASQRGHVGSEKKLAFWKVVNWQICSLCSKQLGRTCFEGVAAPGARVCRARDKKHLV